MPDENLRPGGTPEGEETVAPQNPPRSIVNPESRTTWLMSSVGMVVAILVLVASVFAFVLVSGDKDDDRVAPDPQTTGTSGERMPRDGSPGGFNPTPRPGDTQAEITFRGSDLLEVGRPAHFDAIVVERTNGDAFWVRDNGQTIQVVAPGGTPTVKAGQRVNIDGTVEAGGESPRVKATRIEVK